jgi:hypothetical protein
MSLLVAVLVIGGGLGWVAAKFRRARRQHDAAVAAVALHGTVDYGEHFRLQSWGRLQMRSPADHTWLRKRFGDDLFETVTKLEFFRCPEVTNADMTLLDAFPDLEDLHVSGARSPTSPASPISRSSGG